MIQTIVGQLQIERHDRKEGKVANTEADLSGLWHMHSCSERQNMENPGWKGGTSTVWTVEVPVSAQPHDRCG